MPGETKNLNLPQLVDFIQKNQFKASKLDHIYTNNEVIVGNMRGFNCGSFAINCWSLNMWKKSNYLKDTFVHILSETNFELTIIQDLCNHIERNIISAIFLVSSRFFYFQFQIGFFFHQ